MLHVATSYISYLDGGSRRGRGHGRLQDGRQGVVGCVVVESILLQRDSVEVAKQVIQEFGSELVVEPVLLVGREHGVVAVLVRQRLREYVGVVVMVGEVTKLLLNGLNTPRTGTHHKFFNCPFIHPNIIVWLKFYLSGTLPWAIALVRIPSVLKFWGPQLPQHTANNTATLTHCNPLTNFFSRLSVSSYSFLSKDSGNASHRA